MSSWTLGQPPPVPLRADPDVEGEAIERTAREGEFRRHTGLAEAVPGARFPITDASGYGELLMAVQSYSFDRVLALGRSLAAADAARLWYDEKYLPTVAEGRDTVDDLLDSCTDTDLFLMVHRHERGAWGSVCGEPECIADMLLAEQRRAALDERSALDRVLRREPKPRAKPEPALPSAPHE